MFPGDVCTRTVRNIITNLLPVSNLNSNLSNINFIAGQLPTYFRFHNSREILRSLFLCLQQKRRKDYRLQQEYSFITYMETCIGMTRIIIGLFFYWPANSNIKHFGSIRGVKLRQKASSCVSNFSICKLFLWTLKSVLIFAHIRGEKITANV